jgi:tripartite-type tricarboxylate transporter receptor subunit TctC
MRHSHHVTKFLAGVFVLGCSAAVAQEQYPGKVIRLITAASGGNADVLGRFIQSGLTASLGQQVIVDNRGAIAPAVVAKSPPDGYTILVSGSPLWLLPLLKPGVPWDVRDFAPITLATSSPSVLVVHPSLPVKTVGQLIALAQSRPGELNYAVGTLGATPHLAGELFKHMARVNIVRVGYKGTGPGVIALMSGEVHLMFPGAPAAMPYVSQGRLRALAVCSADPSPFAPGVPTVAASGPRIRIDVAAGHFCTGRHAHAHRESSAAGARAHAQWRRCEAKAFQCGKSGRDELSRGVCVDDERRHRADRQTRQGSRPANRVIGQEMID